VDAEGADFAAALEAFAAAEAGHGLTRGDLVRLYAHRAVVRFAVGNHAAMEADLVRLLALDPEATPPASAPPPVRAALERVRAQGVDQPRLTAHPVQASDGVRVMARVTRGPPDLVTKVRVFARIRGTDRWVSGDRRVSVLAGPGTHIDWYAEAVGPGGAVIARIGRADRPRGTRAGGS
jgi:hypothetical protein